MFRNVKFIILKPLKDITNLSLVAVAPINSILDRPAFVIIFDGPVMVHRHQTSGEEVVVTGIYY